MTRAYPFAKQNFSLPADMKAEEAAYHARPMLIIRGPKPIRWMLLLRRTRRVIVEISWMIFALAGAGAGLGVCVAVWLLLMPTLKRIGPN